MKDIHGEIQYRGKTYRLDFNLNVMEAIQEEYGSVSEWGDLTDGQSGEPNAKAVIFGFTQMLNEGLEIEAEETGEPIRHFTTKQVGRMITEVGLVQATQTLNETVVESTKVVEKNG